MSNEIKPDIILDCIGLFCPMPILKVREGIDKLNENQILELIADDPAAEEDLKYFAKTTGNELIQIKREGDALHFLIRKKEKNP